jgi:hypothetical protein
MAVRGRQVQNAWQAGPSPPPVHLSRKGPSFAPAGLHHIDYLPPAWRDWLKGPVVCAGRVAPPGQRAQTGAWPWMIAAPFG